MESTRTVPNLTDEEEQRLAAYLLQRTRSYDSPADTDDSAAVSAQSVNDSKERAEKACATLEGILLLLSVAESFHKHVQTIANSISDNTNAILSLCSHLKLTNYYDTENFMDVLRYKFHLMIHEPDDILTAAPVIESTANPLFLLTDEMKNKMASNRDSQLHPRDFSSELESVLAQFELDKTDPQDFDTCMRYARAVEADLQEQARLQEALNTITRALDKHAVKTIMDSTTAIGVDQETSEFPLRAKALLDKRDHYLQKYGEYRYGKTVLAALVATVNITKSKSHDEQIYKLASDIAGIGVKHFPDIFKNKMGDILRDYDRLPDGAVSNNIRLTVTALKKMQYTVVNDYAKIAVLRITRGAPPRSTQTVFSTKLFKMLDGLDLAKVDKRGYQRCVQLAHEMDDWIFALGKLHFLKKTAAFWLDYHNSQYNKIISDMLQDVNDTEATNHIAQHIYESCGMLTCKSLIEILEYKLSHGIGELHHANLRKSHHDYPSHSELSQSGTLRFKNKSSKLLMLGKFASKNLDDEQESHVMTINQIRNYEKLRQAFINVIEMGEARLSDTNESDDSPHSNLPEAEDSTREIQGSHYHKNH